MCGIFGILADSKSRSSDKTHLQRIVKRLLLLSEIRGKEASGLAALASDQITVLKRPLAANRLVRTSVFEEVARSAGFPQQVCTSERAAISSKQVANGSYASTVPASSISNGNEGVVAAIGHARLVTNGIREMHMNNQPVVSSGMVAIHNGIIVNDSELFDELPLGGREFEVDSEVIPKLFRYFLNEGLSLEDAARKAFGLMKGQVSTGVLFEDLNRVLFATNNGSLYMMRSLTENVAVFASEKFIIDSFIRKTPASEVAGPFEVEQVSPGTGVIIDLDEFRLVPFSLRVANRHAEMPIFRNPPRTTVDVSSRITVSTSTRGAHAPAYAGRSFSDAGKLEIDAPTFSRFERHYSTIRDHVDHLRRCSKCVLPETFPYITFNAHGVCNYCVNYVPVTPSGPESLETRLREFRNSSGKPDCIVSLSGGRDSSYALHYVVKELGLRPITYTYDWGMVTDIARRNISRMCGQLGIEHILVSANIPRKRANIRKNVLAWLRKPELGLVPLFMAGDKQYFYHGARLMKQFDVEVMVLAENLLERTNFKTGYCGVRPTFESNNTYGMSIDKNLKMVSYYLINFFRNPGYINSSLLDTFLAYCSYYVLPHNFLSLFRYLRWDESTVNDTLISGYEWEIAHDTESTWRIGDGTASFYNYIYFIGAGFSENDTFRSNQIREGMMSRESALRMVNRDNMPRWDSMQWYCDTIGISFEDAILAINETSQKVFGR